MTRPALPLLAIVAAVLVACQSTPANPLTYNFDRPVDVDLVCLNVNVDSAGNVLAFGSTTIPLALPRPAPQPLTACSAILNPLQAPTAMCDPAGGLCISQRLFALVTQSDRGEVAVVNLHPSIGTGILDYDPNVPGFTFIPVGAFPSAIAADPRGFYTYVANGGGDPNGWSIAVLDNTGILSVHSGPAVVFTTPPGALPSWPSDLAIVRVAGSYFLYVTFPDAGVIRIYDITAPAAANGYGVASGTTLVIGGAGGGGLDGGVPMSDASVDATATDGTATDGSALDGGMPDASSPDGGSPLQTPHPFKITVGMDPGTGDANAVYVSDSVLPIIHSFLPQPGATAMETTPLQAGVATHAIAVTPIVRHPAIAGPFVYATSVYDGSLMVLDTTTHQPVLVNAVLQDPACQVGTPTFNLAHCTRIDPRVDWYRIPVPQPVQSLTVSTRDALDPLQVQGSSTFCSARVDPADTNSPLDPLSYCAAISGEDPGPNTLRGIQVVAALRTGQMQVIDVEDLQAGCPQRRTPYGVSTGNTPLNEFYSPFQPHTLRAQALLPNVPPVVSAPVVHVYVPGSGPNSQNGTTYNGAGQPSLAPVTSPIGGLPCADSSQTGVCIANNALAAREDTWTLTYEGILYGGSFAVPLDLSDAGAMTINLPEGEFCTRGVVDGDVVAISNPSYCFIDPITMDSGVFAPLPDGACGPDGGAIDGLPFCQAWFGRSDEPCNRDLVIDQAFNDHLVVHVPAQADGIYGEQCGPRTPASGDPTNRDALIAAIRACYPGAVRADARASHAWVPYASIQQYVHNVHTGAGGHCEADPNVTPSGRIREGVLYNQGGWQLIIQPGTEPTQSGQPIAVPSTRSSTIQFSITGGYTPLLLSAGVLPTAMLYSCVDRRIYMVDQSRNSLMEFNPAPLGVPRTFN